MVGFQKVLPSSVRAPLWKTPESMGQHDCHPGQHVVSQGTCQCWGSESLLASCAEGLQSSEPGSVGLTAGGSHACVRRVWAQAPEQVGPSLPPFLPTFLPSTTKERASASPGCSGVPHGLEEKRLYSECSGLTVLCTQPRACKSFSH